MSWSKIPRATTVSPGNTCIEYARFTCLAAAEAPDELFCAVPRYVEPIRQIPRAINDCRSRTSNLQFGRMGSEKTKPQIPVKLLYVLSDASHIWPHIKPFSPMASLFRLLYQACAKEDLYVGSHPCPVFRDLPVLFFILPMTCFPTFYSLQTLQSQPLIAVSCQADPESAPAVFTLGYTIRLKPRIVIPRYGLLFGESDSQNLIRPTQISFWMIITMRWGCWPSALPFYRRTIVARDIYFLGGCLDPCFPRQVERSKSSPRGNYSLTSKTKRSLVLWSRQQLNSYFVQWQEVVHHFSPPFGRTYQRIHDGFNDQWTSIAKETNRQSVWLAQSKWPTGGTEGRIKTSISRWSLGECTMPTYRILYFVNSAETRLHEPALVTIVNDYEGKHKWRSLSSSLRTKLWSRGSWLGYPVHKSLWPCSLLFL